MGSFGRVTVGERGQLEVTEETTFGTPVMSEPINVEDIFPPENKLDKVLRTMGVAVERTFTADDFKRATAPFRPGKLSTQPEKEFDVNAMYRKFLKV